MFPMNVPRVIVFQGRIPLRNIIKKRSVNAASRSKTHRKYENDCKKSTKLGEIVGELSSGKFLAAHSCMILVHQQCLDRGDDNSERAKTANRFVDFTCARSKQGWGYCKGQRLPGDCEIVHGGFGQSEKKIVRCRVASFECSWYGLKLPVHRDFLLLKYPQRP